MGERKTGLGPLPTGLIRPTTPPREAPEVEAEAAAAGPIAGDDPAEAAEGQGRGGQPAAGRATATRKRRPPAGGETRGRKLQLPDDLHDRLWLLARQRRKTVSAVAAEILDRNLPRFTIVKEG